MPAFTHNRLAQLSLIRNSVKPAKETNKVKRTEKKVTKLAYHCE